MEKNQLESMNKLLRVIVALLLRQQIQDTLSLKEQIRILDNLDIKPIEIAEILGRSNKYINKELSELRKLKKTKNNTK